MLFVYALVPLLAILVIIFCCLLVGLYLFLFSLFFTFIKTRGGPSAPYVPLPFPALHQLARMMVIKDEDIIYDLGAGDGRVLRTLWLYHKKGTYIGIERNFLVFFLGNFYTRFFSRKHRTSSIHLKFGDVFDHDFSHAQHITLYLFPKVLDALLPKFQSELQPGTRVYSVDFQFAMKQPKECVSLNRDDKALARTVYIYEF
jgi:hypothetical protein